jgi:hypothetical protein
LAEYAQKISAHDLPDAFLGISAAAHGCDDEQDIADVSHGKRKSGTTIEVGPRITWSSPTSWIAIGDLEPVARGELQTIGHIIFFSPLVNCMARMFLAGKSPYPIERTLLTTGLTAAGVDSLYAGQERSKTPHLAIHYQPNPISTFWTSWVSFDLSQQLSRRTLLGTAAALALAREARTQANCHDYDGLPRLSHGQHMGDRFLVGYPHNGAWHMPGENRVGRSKTW